MEIILLITGMLMFIYMIRMIKLRNKLEDIDKNYDKILYSDEFKTKGRFE